MGRERVININISAVTCLHTKSLAVGVETVGSLFEGTDTGLHLVNLITVRLQRHNWREECVREREREK